MKHIFLTLLSTLLLTINPAAAGAADSATSASPKHGVSPSYISLNSGAGWVIPTKDFLRGENQTYYSTTTLKYAITAAGDRWQDYAYGMPYYGVGVSQSFFGRADELGNPISLFIFQGATISQITPRLSFNYELELGFSAGWKPYDPFTNPENLVIGSTVNVHAAANLFLRWQMSRRLDLSVGGSLAHFSNGTSRQPNSGVNKGGGYLELAYKFNPSERELKEPIESPQFTPHIEQDVQVVISSRNIKVDTLQTNLPDIYTDKQFDVYGLNYFLMRSARYNARYGVGVEYLYDESREARVYNKLHPESGKYYTVTELASLGTRSSLGISARYEVVQPYYSIFFDVGTTLINRAPGSPLLNQALGVKVHLSPNLFGTFGIKATNLSKAQFLYWSMGYTFNSNRSRWFQFRRVRERAER